MNPHYYLMKNKKILRLEENTSFSSLPSYIRDNLLIPSELTSMNQEQANWRVVLFRDEIMEFDEYQEWMKSPEAMAAEETEYDLIAN